MNATRSPAGAQVRPAVCAGRFYPAAPDELRATVQGHLAAAAAYSGRPPKALVAPHAGYVYSGAIAGSAYRSLHGCVSGIRRVVILGPSHYGARHGLNLTSAGGFATPLGVVPCSAEARARLARLPDTGTDDAAHVPEHCLEVQLPFLQVVLGAFEVVPVLVADADEESVAGALREVWGGAETLIVVSSDLSHYHDYRTAQALDASTAEAIAQLESARLSGSDACGCRPIGGLLRMARTLGLAGKLLDLRNSGDTAGSPNRVVGYGAFVFTETPTTRAAA